jgi:hypothetical protein
VKRILFVSVVAALLLGLSVLAFRHFQVADRSAKAETVTVRDWKQVQFTDSLTGEKTVEYAGTAQTLDGPNGLTAVLWIRCRHRSQDAVVVFNKIFSFNKYPSWRMSQDGQVVQKGFISARAMDDGKTVYLRDDPDTQDFFDILKDEGKDLRLRISVSEGASVTMRLGLRGAFDSVANVRSECSK